MDAPTQMVKLNILFSRISLPPPHATMDVTTTSSAEGPAREEGFKMVLSGDAGEFTNTAAPFDVCLS